MSNVSRDPSSSPLRALHRAPAIQVGALRDWTTLEADLPTAGLPSELDGFRILHLSDTHFRAEWHPSYDRMLAEIEQLNVDLIAFTGDWVEDKFDFRPGLPTAQRFARGLKARLGVFSCLGNHDGDLIAPYLIDAGVRLLVGQIVRILGGESSIEIIGIPGVSREDYSDDLLDSFGLPAPDAFRLVLSHYPDAIRRTERLGAHLTLSGHTHGGQVCLPGGRPIITHDTLHWTRSRGLHELSPGHWLNVSRGLGCSAYRVRTFASPEMTVLRLVRAR